MAEFFLILGTKSSPGYTSPITSSFFTELSFDSSNIKAYPSIEELSHLGRLILVKISSYDILSKESIRSTFSDFNLLIDSRIIFFASSTDIIIIFFLILYLIVCLIYLIFYFEIRQFSHC